MKTRKIQCYNVNTKVWNAKLGEQMLQTLRKESPDINYASLEWQDTDNEILQVGPYHITYLQYEVENPTGRRKLPKNSRTLPAT